MRKDQAILKYIKEEVSWFAVQVKLNVELDQFLSTVSQIQIQIVNRGKIWREVLYEEISYLFFEFLRILRVPILVNVLSMTVLLNPEYLH